MPDFLCFIPAQFSDLGMEQRVVIEIILAADALALFKNLRCESIFARRHMAGLFQQRHINERRGIAHGPWVAIPIPGTAEVSALFDNADVLDAVFDATRAGNQPRETTANESEGHMVFFRFALCAGHIRVFQVVRQLLLDFDVLIVSVFAQSLVTLLAILLAQYFFIELNRFVVRGF